MEYSNLLAFTFTTLTTSHTLGASNLVADADIESGALDITHILSRKAFYSVTAGEFDLDVYYGWFISSVGDVVPKTLGVFDISSGYIMERVDQNRVTFKLGFEDALFNANSLISADIGGKTYDQFVLYEADSHWTLGTTEPATYPLKDAYDGSTGPVDCSFTFSHGVPGLDSLVASGAIEGAALAATYILAADDLAAGSAIEGEAIAQTYLLAAGDLAAGADIESGAAAQTHTLTSDNLAAAGEIESGDLGQTFFTIIDVDLDDTIYHGQTDVEVHGVGFGVVTGFLDVGGVFQSGLTWEDDTITISTVDAGGLDLGFYNVTVYRPI